MSVVIPDPTLTVPNLAGANLAGAKYDAGTTWPVGVDAGARGAVVAA